MVTSRTLHIRVSEELIGRIAAAAERDMRNESNWIRMVLVEKLDALDHAETMRKQNGG